MKEQPSPKIRVVVLVFMLVCTPPNSVAQIVYVDSDAPPGGNGLDWATAFEYLQHGLAVASYGDEIRVAQGRYVPDRNSANPSGAGDREATFQLVSG